MSTFDSIQGTSFSTNLHTSKDSKREVLWNIIEPGDAYDIRK